MPIISRWPSRRFRMRVLIVDDDEMIRMMLEDALVGAGYEVAI